MISKILMALNNNKRHQIDEIVLPPGHQHQQQQYYHLDNQQSIVDLNHQNFIDFQESGTQFNHGTGMSVLNK